MNKLVISNHETGNGTVRSYTIGFIFSLLLTIAAYLLVTRQVTSGWGLIYALATLAIVQLFVQLLYFLHLGHESRPRWNLQVLIFAAGVVGIIVFGSLWIMQNLSYAHHSVPSTPEIIKDEGYKP